MSTHTSPSSFSVNFDYRCPFARNANEHVVAALDAGAPWTVRFLPFSLSQAHVADGESAIWHDPAKRSESLAMAAGVVVRDRFPEKFNAAHLALFAARHDEHGDVRDDAVVTGALRRAGVDVDAVHDELEAGWPFDTVQAEHELAVAEHDVFGVPTFVVADNAAFVRIMTRPQGDGAAASRTIQRVVDLLGEATELNEFKHTTVPR